MEREKNYENKERIFSIEEIAKVLGAVLEGRGIMVDIDEAVRNGRKIEDESGIVWLEISVNLEDGESLVLEFTRKPLKPGGDKEGVGKISKKYPRIDVGYFRDGMPYGGEHLATFDKEKNQWKFL